MQDRQGKSMEAGSRAGGAFARLFAAAWFGLAAGLPGCSGGGGGGGGPLEFVSASVEELGDLPLDNVFLNNAITVEFNLPLDPDSVSSQTFRIMKGPAFVEEAAGDLTVDGRHIRFFPRLPHTADLTDSGFRPDTQYRVLLRGRPDLNTIRSRRGHPLLEMHSIDFTTRQVPPLFFDPVPGLPRVIGVAIDLDGDGELDVDGLEATPEDEEFFAGEVFFDDTIPFVSDVRVGSSNLPEPDVPLRVGLLFNEPLLPSILMRDSDRDGNADLLAILDRTNPFLCDDPGPGDFCDRPIDFDVSIEQREMREANSFFVLVSLQVPYGLSTLARHQILARLGVVDLAGNRMRSSFRAVFETAAERPSDDFLIEDFSELRQRDSATTALWNPAMWSYLRAGIGFGGDGSDGEFIGNEIDSTDNDGIFNFTNIDTTANVIAVKGDKPVTIRVFGDLFLPLSQAIRCDGGEGQPGRADDVSPVLGGIAGPGGFAGGAASVDGAGTMFGEPGLAPEGSDGGGEGGESASGPGGGGGGGHASSGENGRSGSEGQGGRGGRFFGDSNFEELNGGGGGGGGGNNPAGPEGSPGSSGGSGGGGGGVLIVEAFGTISSPNIFPYAGIFANGGQGGTSARADSGDHSSSGGGGAGGTIWIRARDVSNRLFAIEALGAQGGGAISPGGRGGRGARGLIRVDTLNATVDCELCDPSPLQERISPDIIGRSLGRSRFLATHVDPGTLVEYSFDGSVPNEDGRILPGKDDIDLITDEGLVAAGLDELPPNATARIYFRGAMEDIRVPNQPDPATITPWFTDLGALTGMTMIQWEVRFFLGVSELTLDPMQDPPALGVDNVRIRFHVP